MATEAPTLPPHPSLDGPAHQVLPAVLSESDTHGFTFADPDSRFAKEFGGAYQESLAQVRAETAVTTTHPSHTAAVETSKAAETLDVTAIRAQVDELTNHTDPSTTSLPYLAETIPASVPGNREYPVAANEQLPTQMGTAFERNNPIKRAAHTTRQRAANLVYSYMGNKTPKFVKNHVPVYRAVSKSHAGFGNQWGVSEWTIGAGKGPRKHAMEWVRNNTYDPLNPETAHLQGADEYVAIQTTLGELERSGRPEVRHYGDYGSAQKKVVLQHANPAQPVTHRVIASNKH